MWHTTHTPYLFQTNAATLPNRVASLMYRAKKKKKKKASARHNVKQQKRQLKHSSLVRKSYSAWIR